MTTNFIDLSSIVLQFNNTSSLFVDLQQNLLTLDGIFSSNLLSTNINDNLNLPISNILGIYYDSLFQNNYMYILNTFNKGCTTTAYFSLFFFIKNFFKINIILFILYTIFFLTYLENYMKQLIYMNSLVRLFILNESEKEVGPVDDFFFFAILFMLTISSFIFVSLITVIFHSKVYIWTIGSLILISMLILTVPVNLFLDFGVAFFVYIRGSASSSSLIKELLFDIISTATVFIRFVIQNIRFLFIFSAIFELLEWVFSNNSGLFIINSYTNNNVFVNFSLQDYFFSNKSINLIIVNSIMFIILYFYYFLHLLFLLLVQITIYIGISVWLFFFLYSTKFLGKYEKFFIFKKN